jgi:Ser/Thr protein kinase RdoA (MazF antagonist)
MDTDDAEISYTKAAREALTHFPIEAEGIDLVTHSENVTFRVTVRGGDKDYVLRLHRPGYNSIEELESEREWIVALKETGVAVQDSLETREGGFYTLVDIPGVTENRYAGMTTWQEGKPLGEFLDTCTDETEKQRIFRRFGEIAASFHNQSTSWVPPAGFTRRRLDLDALLGESPFWGRFWEHAELNASEQELLLQARASTRSAIEAYGETPNNFSLIHADFTPDNMIYNDGELAVIDFDDSAYGWHMYDIASALIECEHDEGGGALQAAFLDGYRQHRRLESRDLKMLPDFLLVRGMAIIGWFHQRPEHAGSAEFSRTRDWVLEECRRRNQRR